MAGGLPDGAFTPLEGDERTVVTALKRRNRVERDGQLGLFAEGLPGFALRTISDAAAQRESLPDDSIDGVHKKERALHALERSPEFQRARLVADTWCAAFVMRKVDAERCITHDVVQKVAAGQALVPALHTEVERLAGQYRFFHWHLAFPEVFRVPKPGEEAGEHGWRGGFDVVLGNPPWERVKLQEKEWFAFHRPDITAAGNAAARRQMIATLEQEDPRLYAAFLDARRQAEAESAFLRGSGRYPLCGRGDVNTFTVFAEWNHRLVGPAGRVGCIVPSGIATDDTTKEFFQSLMATGRLARLMSFAEIREFFPGSESRNAFCLLTLTGAAARASTAEFIFGLWSVEEALDSERWFTLSAEDISLLNPNTGTCPVFGGRSDAEVAKRVYRRLPVLMLEGPPEQNPWKVRMGTMFHMANDSHLFRERAQLEADGWQLQGNTFVKGKARYLPLYEAKMVHHYDHRLGTYEGQTEAQSNQGILPRLTSVQHADPTFLSLPWFWVPAHEVEAAIGEGWARSWLLGWRDICRSTDERTTISAFIPRAGVGDQFLLMFSEERAGKVACLGANLNSLCFDYFARQKVGGTHLKFFTMRQLPVLPPSAYDTKLSWLSGAGPAEGWFTARMLELTYTAHDMESFARDLGYAGLPFRWDEVRRMQLRSELDAAFFHLYGLNRRGAEHVLDSFQVLKKNEQARFGEFRTKKLVLDCYDKMAEAMVRGTLYQAQADSAPANVGPLRDAIAPLPGRTLDIAAALRSAAVGAWERSAGLSDEQFAVLTLSELLRNLDQPAKRMTLDAAAMLVARPALCSAFLEKPLRSFWVKAIGREAQELPPNVILLREETPFPGGVWQRALEFFNGIITENADGLISIKDKSSLEVPREWLRFRVAVALECIKKLGSEASSAQVVDFVSRRGKNASSTRAHS